MKNFKVFLMVLFVFGLIGLNVAQAATSPILVGADTFSIVAGQTVTNTGISSTDGDIGISPGAGAPPNLSDVGTLTIGGTLYDVDGGGIAAAAQADNTATFLALSAIPNVSCNTTYAGIKDLAGMTLVPGIYCAGTFELSGTLTLNALGNPNAVWIFRSAATLTTSSGVAAKVQFLGDVGSACNVWWKVVSSATIGTYTTFVGNILASTSISLLTGATLDGRAMAQTGSVTMDTNTISGPVCSALTATINVIKHVDNTGGGTAVASDFNLHLKQLSTGLEVGGGPYNGVESPGWGYDIGPGTYVVSEDNPGSRYTQSFSGDCNTNGRITLVTGNIYDCTLTNTYHRPSSSGGSSPVITQTISASPATLTIIKRVVGSSANASIFNLHVKNAGTDVLGSPNVGVVSPGIYYSLPVGTYVVSEDANSSYTKTFSGDCDLNGSVTLSSGQNKTCTVINTSLVSPLLPKTGFAPYAGALPWKIMIPLGLVGILVFSFFALKKRIS